MNRQAGSDTATRLPAVIEADPAERDLLVRAARERERIDATLLEHGGILFRGFAALRDRDLERFAGLFGFGPMGYEDRATKRSSVSGKVYTSTTTPPRYNIVLHNESSFAARWPRHLVFYCREPAAEGGCTPIADVRRVHDRIDPAIRERFERLGVLYQRNYGHGPGMDWREVFQVDDEAGLEDYCRRTGIEFEWLGDGRLRTRQVRPAIAVHPETGERVWFNHGMTLHVSSLQPVLRDTLLRQYDEADLPHNTYYGDGTPIEPEVMDHIRDAYEQETVRFDWQRHDLVLLDNLLACHGRDPFKGERTVVAVLASPTRWDEIEHTAAPAPGAAPTPAAAPDAPATDPAAGAVSAFLCAVAAELLEVDAVAPDDNLFDLGADSLVATQMIARVRERFGHDLPLRAFFDTPNVRGLVAQLAA